MISRNALICFLKNYVFCPCTINTHLSIPLSFSVEFASSMLSEPEENKRRFRLRNSEEQSLQYSAVYTILILQLSEQILGANVKTRDG